MEPRRSGGLVDSGSTSSDHVPISGCDAFDALGPVITYGIRPSF